MEGEKVFLLDSLLLVILKIKAVALNKKGEHLSFVQMPKITYFDGKG